MAPDKPWFMYCCLGAGHAPHHVFKEWADKYRGRFDQGYDNTIIVVVSDNGSSGEGGPNGSFNENKFFNIVPDTIEENLRHLDELGGPRSYNHYNTGWAWAWLMSAGTTSSTIKRKLRPGCYGIDLPPPKGLPVAIAGHLPLAWGAPTIDAAIWTGKNPVAAIG